MRKLLVSLGLLVSVVACAMRTYPYYILRYRQGTLNHPTDGSKSLPISECDDTALSRANCYVMLRADFIKLNSDLIEAQRQLAACQKK